MMGQEAGGGMTQRNQPLTVYESVGKRRQMRELKGVLII
jgi:hypothetical protein